MQMTRFPWVGRGVLPNGGQGTYLATGREEIKASVDRTPPAPPAAPAGVVALEQEIGANQARQAEIKVQLAELETVYAEAALRWDVDQLVQARTEMNAAADKMRSLRHEQNDLADELPRLQKRLAAARTAQRHAEHVEDLAQLERALDEFGPIVAEYAQCAVDLVVLADELTQRRGEILRLRRRTVDWSDHTGAPKCGRDINKEASVPPFYEVWLQGGARNVADAKRALGIQD
jgi:hypothetical protein